MIRFPETTSEEVHLRERRPLKKSREEVDRITQSIIEVAESVMDKTQTVVEKWQDKGNLLEGFPEVSAAELAIIESKHFTPQDVSIHLTDDIS
jgi:hypothetical protein